MIFHININSIIYTYLSKYIWYSVGIVMVLGYGVVP